MQALPCTRGVAGEPQRAAVAVETGQVQLRRFGHQRQAGLRGVGVGIEAELVQPLLQPVQRQRAGGCQNARRLRQVGVEYGQCRVDAGFFP